LAERGGFQDELFGFVNFLGTFERSTNSQKSVNFQPVFTKNQSISDKIKQNCDHFSLMINFGIILRE